TFGRCAAHLQQRSFGRRRELSLRDWPRLVGAHRLGRVAQPSLALALYGLRCLRDRAVLLPSGERRALWPRPLRVRGGTPVAFARLSFAHENPRILFRGNSVSAGAPASLRKPNHGARDRKLLGAERQA